MKKKELDSIISGKAYLEYIGNLFEYSHTEHNNSENWHHFLNVNDGHEIYYSEKTILNCPLHFQYLPFTDVSKSSPA